MFGVGGGMRSRASRDAFPSGAWERHRGGGALLPFVLRVVAGACVGRGSGQPRMPPRERQHEGLGGIGGFFCGWTGSRCGSGRLTTGVVRHACRLRRDGTRRFLVWGILLRLDWEPLQEPALDHGSGQTRNLSSASERRQMFGVGGGMRSRASRDAFPSGAWERHRGGGALLPFVLRVVAGACVGRGSGQPRMPPRERQHEGLGGIGGFFCGWTGSRCGSGRLTTGVVSHAKLRGGGRGSPRLAWSMPPGVGVLEIRAWEPAGAGDSGYFPRGIVPGPRSATRKIPE